MKKIYISGCGGMLGEALHAHLKDDYELKCTDIDVNESWLDYCDIRNLNEYQADVEVFNPDWLCHLGAYTDLEYCELHQMEAHRTNTASVANATHIANELCIPLVYISTAGIFDGRKNAYDEWDMPSPVGTYAKTKYAGEVFVKRNAFKHLMIRPGWMMGGGPRKDKKFIQKIMRQIKDGSKQLLIVNDKLGTPTYTHDFANNLKLLMDRHQFGIFHMACEGQTSRLEIARELLKILALDKDIEIIEVSSSHFSKEYFAPRPKSERLINRKLNDKGLNIMRNWKVALRDYIEGYYGDYLIG